MSLNNAKDWAQWVFDTCMKHRDRPFITQHGSDRPAITFGAWAEAMEDYLLPREVTAADTPVILLFDNTVDSLVLFFALLERGIKPVLMHRGTPEKDRAEVAGILGSQWMVESVDFSCTCTRVDGVSDTAVSVEIAADVAYLVFTSGSSGQPKGIQITYDNMQVEVESMTRAYRLTAEDRHLCVLPIYHASGLYRNILIPFFCGAQTTLVEQLDVEQFWELVEQYKVQFVQVTPTVIKALLHYRQPGFTPPAALRYVGSASAPHPEELVRAFEDTFAVPLAVGYGMTEATCGITLNATMPRTNYSVGQPIDAMRLAIMRDGVEQPAGEQGEVAISGNNLMRGYLNVGQDEHIRIDRGQLYTGDIGYVDAGGYLYIVGRNNDIVKRGDFRLNLLEIERAIATVDEVAEACVIDVPHSLLGSDVIAFVVSKDGAARRSREWLRLFKSVLESQKMPSEFLDIDEIPKFGALKVNRRALKERYAEMKAARKQKKQ